jgi:hypothetical protein
MKRIITICVLAVGLAVVTSNAASLNWGTSGLGTPIQNSSGAALATGMDVLLVWDTTGAGLGLQSDGGTVSFGANVKVVSVSSIGTTAGRVPSVSAVDSTWAYSQTLDNVYIIAFNSSDWQSATAFAVKSKSGIVLGANSSATPPTYYLGTATSLQRILSGDWAGITVIPEPTSMALLALGAGVVGLRRRIFRRK